MDNTCSQHRSNKAPEFTVLASEPDTIEVPVDAGDIKFMLDVSDVQLLRDNADGSEVLECRISLRGVSSKGEPLELCTDANLIAS